MINRIFLKKKFLPKLYFLNCDNLNINIEYNHRKREKIICSKFKRRDEILKFSYKFIRRKLITNYAKSEGFENNPFSVKKLLFEHDFIKNDKSLKKNFFCYEVSKKNLEFLKKNKIISQKLKNYYKNDFLKDMLEELNSHNYDFIFDRENTLSEFLEILYSVQMKKNINVFDIFTSFEVLGHYINDFE